MAPNEIVLLNTLITLTCLWVILFINTRFLQPALFNKTRFRLYELRDRLALMAMKGDIGENSVEYKTLMQLLNFTISGTSSFEAVDFLTTMAKINRDKKLQRKLEKTFAKIDSVNLQYKQIAHEYFEQVYFLYMKHTRLLRYMIIPLLLSLTVLISSIKLLSKFKFFVLRKKSLITHIQLDLKNNTKRFAF